MLRLPSRQLIGVIVNQAASKLKRQEIVQAVASHLVQEGFANSGIRALASSAGISDRMLMYYFETKEELIADALQLLAENMATTLGQLLPERPTPSSDILSAASKAAEQPAMQAALQLWFEMVGLAVRGAEPYSRTVNQILDDWEHWIQRRLRSDQQHRARELLAHIEGELMLQLLRD